MLMLYKSGIIKVTQKFRIGVIAATGGIFLFYWPRWSLASFTSLSSVRHGSGMVGIGFSLVV